MVVNKVLTYTLIAAITLVPWSATAVNRYSFSHLLPKPNLGNLVNIAGDVAERLLVKSLVEITQGRNQQALNTVDELIRTTPNFKLAHLIRGDLLTAQGKYLQAFGGSDSHSPEAVKDLQDEARMRIERYLSNQNTAKFPDLLLAPSEQQSHVIVIDTDKSRLYLYKHEQNSLRYIADYYISVGKNGIDKQSEGDKRTPIGVYFAGPKLTKPLADIYGDGAYPLNYPNEWDEQHNRKGSGIWLHGTPSSTYSRPPRASDGCVVLSNQDINQLAPILQSGKTPVIITSKLKWLSEDHSPLEQQSLKMAIDNWLEDWRSQDTTKYLAHYSRDFFSNGINYQQWSDHKYRVQENKPKVSIELSDISMFAYPDVDKKMVVVDFLQNFSSPALSNKMQKRQYWIQENNTWKIIYEGSV